MEEDKNASSSKLSPWFLVSRGGAISLLVLALIWLSRPERPREVEVVELEPEVAEEVEENVLTGTVVVDGSSTVAPISIAAAEVFSNNSDVEVAVGTSGSGGGFSKFCNGEIDISNASRPIKPAEIEACEANGIEFVELPIAFDGLALVTNPSNPVQCVTTEELFTIWSIESEGEVTNWNQVNPEFPDQKFALFAPGTASGTFDYFVEAILHEDDIRGDFTPSEDDNVIVNGVAGTDGALGFFGLSYYKENQDSLSLVQVDDGNGCVGASVETVADGTYTPLSRPLFVYVNKEAAERPEVSEFMDFYVAESAFIAAQVGYIGLPEASYDAIAEHWYSRTTGSFYQGVEPGTPLESLFN